MTRTPQDALHTAAYVTPAGADWLASASASPRGVQALWAGDPTAAVTLPCGTAFDVISMDALFGRRVVGRLWTDGPGTGPVAARGGRVMLFATPGTAQRLAGAARLGGVGCDRSPAALLRAGRRGDRAAAVPAGPRSAGGGAPGARGPGDRGPGDRRPRDHPRAVAALAGRAGCPQALAARSRGTAVGLCEGGPRRRW